MSPVMRFRSCLRWRRGILGLGVLSLILAVACSSSVTPSTAQPTVAGDEIRATPPSTSEASPTETPTSVTASTTPTAPPPTQTEPTTAPSPTPVRTLPDLSEVPPVNLDVHSVPLEDVVFDTFDGSYVSLSDATPTLIERLKDAIAPIYTPQYSGPDGLDWLQDNDMVIGYESEGDAYAYPINILKFHELVNDSIDGVPVLISYCPLCASGVVYSRALDGDILTFGNTSALFEMDLVMYDPVSWSYWFQVLGEAIVGDLTEKRLTLLPSVTTTWAEWKRLHPDTNLLTGFQAGGPSFPGVYGSGPFPGSEDAAYESSLDRGDFRFPLSEEKLDDRLRPSERVLTVEVGSAAKAYPILLMGDIAVNDVIGGEPVAVFSGAGTFTAAAYLATVDDTVLRFRIEGRVYIDDQTGSTWNKSGVAVDGPMEGRRLEPAPSRSSFWVFHRRSHSGPGPVYTMTSFFSTSGPKASPGPKG